jgi:hypothetical protein
VEDKRILKMKEQLSKRRYKQVTREFYDDIKEMMLKKYVAKNFISQEDAEDFTLLKCIQIMPAVMPNNRVCYLLLKDLFFVDDISEKEKILRILKSYKKISETFKIEE